MKLANLALTGLFRLPDPVLRRLAGPALRVDGQQLDTQSQLLMAMSSVVQSTPIEQQSVAEARRTMERATATDSQRPKLAQVRDLTMGLPASSLRARVYTPIDAEDTGAGVVYFHGGGWVIGSLDTADAYCAELAAAAGVVVVSVDYRLAPEHRFPTAAMDAVDAFDWVHSEHTHLGIDPERLGVAGDSAGGNLAAVVAQQRRATVRYQLLIYPATDLAHESASYALFRSSLFLTDASMRWFIERYVPDAEQRTDVRASPLLAEDLSGVAPACVLVVGFDPLRDEGRAYAARLDAAGSLDQLIEDPSLPHGCMAMTAFVARAHYLLTRSARALRTGLRPLSEPSPG